MFLRRTAALGVLAAATALTMAVPAGAQVPDLGDLPLPGPGTVGQLLDPVEDLVETITAPIDEALVDVPLDNAVRLTADDAVGAALALSQATFTESDTALLARDDVFADTLSSVAAQGLAGAPLLLTATLTLDQRVIDEFARLGVEHVIVLGNEHAIDPSVEQFVADLGYTTFRAGGITRIETAVEIARLVAPDADTALLLRGYPDEGADQSQAYADALSVGPLASRNEWPVLLTTSDTLAQSTADYLASSGIERVVVIGGEAAVSGAVAETLSSTGMLVDRIAGANRWATAIEIAGALGFHNAADSSRMILSEAGISGEPLWAAGFAAAAHAAIFEAPVLLTDGALLPPETITYIADGLLENALRVGNEPILCNSFVHILACEAAALLTVGLLDEVDRLTGGQLAQVLGPVFDQLLVLLEPLLPGDDGTSPTLIGQLLGLIGVPGCEDTDCLVAFDSVPAPLGASMASFSGVNASAPRSGTQQAAMIDLVSQLSALLGDRTIDADDPAQNGALASALNSLTTLLDDQLAGAPVGAVEELLSSLGVDLGDLFGSEGLDAVLGGAGVDVPADAGSLLGAVIDLLAVGGDPDSLVDRFGAGAAALADTVEQLQAR